MVARQELSCQVNPEVAQSIRDIAQAQQRSVSDVVEQAVTAFVDNGPRHASDEEVMAHYEASFKKNRRLAELLAE